MSDLLDWTHPVARIPERGLRQKRRASEAERGAIAAALGLVEITALEADYELRPRAGGRYALDGELRARLVQACVVSLDPVPAEIIEPLAAVFCAPADIGPAAEGERDALGPDDPEPIEADRIDVGRIVYEQLAAALDPYPRAPGAELERTSAGGEPGGNEPAGSAGPFAALARLKRPQDPPPEA